MASLQPGWPRPRGTVARDRARQAILEAALRLFAERGYIGVRVEDIAREAGISRATFYKHFAERDEILAGLFGRLLGSATEPKTPPQGDPEARVRALLVEVADRMLEDETLARFVYSLPIRHDAVLPGGAAVPAVFAHVRAVLDQAVDDGELRDDVSLDRAVDMLGRAFEAAMRDWAEGRTDHPRTRLDELLDILFGGLTPGPGRGGVEGRASGRRRSAAAR
jgi:AcrR family transcriptional regulator